MLRLFRDSYIVLPYDSQSIIVGSFAEFVGKKI